MTSIAKRVSLNELFRENLKIGFLSFGGPAGQISLMHRIFVDQKKWVEERHYLHALDYCMLLPGPEAQQLAIYVGWILRGVWGGVIAGVLFVAPGALLMFALAWIYAAYTDIPAVSAIFYGVKAAVLAIVVEAVIKISKRALKGRVEFGVAGIAFILLFLFGAPFPAVILGAALFGALNAVRSPPAAPLEVSDQPSAGSVWGALGAALVWGLLWLGPVAMATLMLGRDHVVTRVGWLFSHLAVVTFGGAYAVLAYLQQQAVELEHWLSAAQMIDGLGLAETTPGPLVLVNQFVGFLAGWNNPDGGLWLAAACAAMASWCTFAPSFLWIFAGAPLLENLRRNRFAAGALRAITAAVLGVVLNLAVWFGLHVVFGMLVEVDMAWGRDLAVPVLESIDAIALMIVAIACLLLIKLRINLILVIGICAGLGLVTLPLR